MINYINVFRQWISSTGRMIAPVKIPKFHEMSNVVRVMKLQYVELDGP